MRDNFEGENDSSMRHRAVLANMRSRIPGLIRKLGEVEQECYNPLAGRVHAAARAVLSMTTTNLRDALVPMREQPEWSTEISLAVPLDDHPPLTR